MGIIACQTPQSIDERGQAIQRKNVTAEENSSCCHVWWHYKAIQTAIKECYGRYTDIQITPVNPVSVAYLHYEHLDTLWLYSSQLYKQPPSWQGFMSDVVTGTCECTTVVYNPMIPLNPQTNEAVYSTMLYVLSQANKLGLVVVSRIDICQPL